MKPVDALRRRRVSAPAIALIALTSAALAVMADKLSDGIIRQFPKRLRGSTWGGSGGASAVRPPTAQ